MIDTQIDFDEFHKKIINTPRGNHSNVLLHAWKGFDVLKSLIEEGIIQNIFSQKIFADNVQFSKSSYMHEINEKENRNKRHYIEALSFLGVIQKYNSEYFISKDILSKIKTLNDFKEYIKEYILDININSWYFLYKKRAELNTSFDFQITNEIIDYINKKIYVTNFEISIIFAFLGDTSENLKKWQIDMKELFKNVFNQKEQEKIFFNKFNWSDKKYKSSQQPFFKFKTFILVLEELELIPKELERRVTSGVKTAGKKTFTRSQIIKKQRLAVSNYISEISSKASFIRKDGTGYVEVHHIIPLSWGGLDTFENTVSLTADEHRAVHLAKKEEIVRINRKIIESLKPDISKMVSSELLEKNDFIDRIKEVGIYE